MDEKKNTFEMDDSHFDSIEEIIRKYKTIEPKASRNKRSDCKREELLNCIRILSPHLRWGTRWSRSFA